MNTDLLIEQLYVLLLCMYNFYPYFRISLNIHC